MDKNTAPATRKRSAGLDIVRTIACLSVIGTHFFLYNPLYPHRFEGMSMFVQGMLISIVIGSDLYMILTGYLCSNKEFGRRFYRSGFKVILSYVFFSILTIVVKKYAFGDELTWRHGLGGILRFNTIPYAWYIEMWIGLFLLAPFLNIWYKAMPSKRMKVYLIGLLFAMAAIPDILNRKYQLMPDYWDNIYPLAFYFLGSFIREYRPAYPRPLLLTGALAIIMASPMFTVIFNYPTFFWLTGIRSSLFMVALASLLFLAFYDVDLRSKGWRNIFRVIALRSLDIFLCSAIFDSYIYPYLKANYYESQAQFGPYYFIVVPLIFCGCYIIASAKRLLFTIIERILRHFNITIPLQNQAR